MAAPNKVFDLADELFKKDKGPKKGKVGVKPPMDKSEKDGKSTDKSDKDGKPDKPAGKELEKKGDERSDNIAQILKSQHYSRRNILIGNVQQVWKVNSTSSRNAHSNADIVPYS